MRPHGLACLGLAIGATACSDLPTTPSDALQNSILLRGQAFVGGRPAQQGEVGLRFLGTDGTLVTGPIYSRADGRYQTEIFQSEEANACAWSFVYYWSVLDRWESEPQPLFPTPPEKCAGMQAGPDLYVPDPLPPLTEISIEGHVQLGGLPAALQLDLVYEVRHVGADYGATYTHSHSDGSYSMSTEITETFCDRVYILVEVPNRSDWRVAVPGCGAQVLDISVPS